MCWQTEYLSPIVCFGGKGGRCCWQIIVIIVIVIRVIIIIIIFIYLFFFLGGGVKEKGFGAIYGLKILKWHTFLNIWLQTCLQARLQTHWL